MPHELRHIAASLAISIKTVQAMLGHAIATLTLDRYGHLFPDDLDGVADRMDDAARASAEVSRTKRGPGVTRLRARPA